MKTKYANLLLFCGVSCFLVGALVALLGRLESPLHFALPALGLILIGTGAAGRQRSNKER